MNTDKRVSTGTRLKQIMSERGLKQVDILKASEPYQKKFNVQLKKSTLSQYVNDKQSPDDNRIYLLSQTLGVSEPWLMGFDVTKENHIKKQMNLESEISNIVRRLDPLKQRKVKNYANSQLYMQLNNSISEKNTSIPVVHNSSVAANPTELSYEDTELHDEGFERIPNNANLAIPIIDDSMEPTIKNGGLVFIHEQPNIENGEIAVVEIDGEGTTCKKVYFDYSNEEIILKSINPKYPDRRLYSDRIRIIGKVVF